VSIYESTALVEQYLLFHYGQAAEILPYEFGPQDALGYPVRMVTQWVDSPLHVSGRALDLGCAVGRSSFELSRYFSAVVGIDLSVKFIEAAEIIRTIGRMKYSRLDEAPRTTELEALRPAGVHPERITFIVGDALDIPERLGRFDLVLAANLVDRVPDPVKLLEGLKSVVAPGGQLVLSSPYTWLEDFTPKNKWLSGFASGSPGTLTAIESILAPNFRLVRSGDQPFLIREHARKFQWSAAQVSVWCCEG
jgi:putative 4-mercaptohistidine N1-methyltranferase